MKIRKLSTRTQRHLARLDRRNAKAARRCPALVR